MNDPMMKPEFWLAAARKELGLLDVADIELEQTVSAIFEKAVTSVTATLEQASKSMTTALESAALSMTTDLDEAKAALIGAHKKRRGLHQAALHDADNHVFLAKVASDDEPKGRLS